MKKGILLTAYCACLGLCSQTVDASVVTLWLSIPQGVQGTNYSAETITIDAGEVATVKYVYNSRYQQGNSGSWAGIEIQSGTNVLAIDAAKLIPGSGSYAGNPMIAGPATVRLYGWSDPILVAATVVITPASFPPDKTVIIPEGTGAKLTLESSTNLISWSEEWSGSYTSVPSHMFFRIRAERFP